MLTSKWVRTPEGDVLTYNYETSGGRIVGRGNRVDWYLAGVDAGTYTGHVTDATSADLVSKP